MPSKYTNKLAGQRILLIGGTSGIGFCIAENALEHGSTVIVASSKQTSINNTLSRLNESYPDLKANISGHVIDLSSPDVENDIVDLLKAATNNGKDLLDHIVVTAGDRPPMGPIDKFDPSTLAPAQQMRLTVPILLAKHAPGAYLRTSNRSSMTITGGNGRPKKNWFVLTMIRGSMEGLTRGLAVELQPIRVNMILPGAIETELFSNRMSLEQLEGFKKTFKDETLTGQIGQPEDMSEAYMYVMRDAYLTGQAVYSDGGLMLAPGARNQ